MIIGRVPEAKIRKALMDISDKGRYFLSSNKAEKAFGKIAIPASSEFRSHYGTLRVKLR
jgi:hypothetical protein